MVVFAGAGSGKTRVITHRIVHLIDVKRVAPWQILALTFTNALRVKCASGCSVCIRTRGVYNSERFIPCARDGCANLAPQLGFDRNFVIYDDGRRQLPF